MNLNETFQGLSDDVVNGISLFIEANLEDWKAHLDDDDEDGMTITFSTNNEGIAWSYQTGDNSFTGGAYSFPHWSVATIYKDTTSNHLFEEVDMGFEDLIN